MSPASFDRRPLERLPIDEVLPELLAALGTTSNLVLLLLRAQANHSRRAGGHDGSKPRVSPLGKSSASATRRLAAVNVAARNAGEQCWQLGQEVGYQVRFERRVGRDTPLVVMTDGMFLQLLQSNPWLDGVSTVIFDEFHERNLNNDLALALCRCLQAEVRPELQLIVMSATLAAEPVAAYLGNAPIINSPGACFR